MRGYLDLPTNSCTCGLQPVLDKCKGLQFSWSSYTADMQTNKTDSETVYVSVSVTPPDNPDNMFDFTYEFTHESRGKPKTVEGPTWVPWYSDLLNQLNDITGLRFDTTN